MSNELIVVEPGSPYALMPVLDIQSAMARRQTVMEYTRRMMVPKIDFGVVPGTGDKPTLLKPGAEKLASLFGLSPLFEAVERVMDWTGDAHGGEPFFYACYRCTLTRGELVAGQGVGSCNSWEKKYRYRNVYPEKATQEEKANGRLETRTGRNGRQYQVYVVKNPDPADVVNTIDKMAQKRALVAAVLIAVNASELFTQDVEDYSDVIDGDWQPATAVKTPPPAPPQPRPAQSTPPANGGQRPQAQPAADNGPLPDDELTIEEATAAQFIPKAADLLKTDAETLKARLKALGYGSIPGKPAERVSAYRKLRADMGAADDLMGDVAGQPQLVTVPQPATDYQD